VVTKTICPIDADRWKVNVPDFTMPGSATGQRVVITLNGPSDWDDWLEVIKTTAIGGEIWELVNPETAKNRLPILKEPPRPIPQHVNRDKTTIAQLSEAEKEQFEFLRFDYHRQISIYDRKKATLASLQTTIQESVSRPLLVYMFNCDTTYDMIIALKKCVAPTDRVRQLETSTKYQRLRKSPRNQVVEPWLQQWECVYAECQKLNLPDIKNDQAIYDFLQAVSSIAPDFASV